MQRNLSLTRNLRSMLENEIRLHRRYIDLLKNEKAAVVASRLDDIETYRKQRELICESILAAKDKRATFMALHPDGKDSKLSDWLKKNVHPQDFRELKPIIDSLKSVLQEEKTANTDFSQLLNFTMSVVNSCSSIVLTASQNVVRSYNLKGNIQERYNPINGRAGVSREV